MPFFSPGNGIGEEVVGYKLQDAGERRHVPGWAVVFFWEKQLLFLIGKGQLLQL